MLVFIDIEFIIFISIIVFVILAITLPIILVTSYRNKHRDFVLLHSLTIRKVNEINKKYKFHHIPNFDLSHTYDNPHFYYEISCIDYLIYELVYIKNKVENAINLCDLNKERYKNYLKNIQDNTERYTFDEEIGTLNKDLLYKFENKILSQILQKPTHEFEIRVKLTQTKINGNYVCSKSKSFDKYEILAVIDELNNKRNGYYLNEDIWEAICMVERGKVSNKMRFAIYERDGYRCRCCGRRTKDLEIDHIIPISKGGKSTYDNLQTLCRRCNKLKGTKTVRY